MGAVPLCALQRAREAVAIDEELALVEEDLRSIAGRPDAEQALVAYFRYLCAVVPDREEPIRTRLRHSLSPDLEERILGTTVKESYEQGRAEGQVLGRAIGDLDARRELLLEVLKTRLGPVPSDLAERIASATREELRTWHMHAIEAASFDEVFATRS